MLKQSAGNVHRRTLQSVKTCGMMPLVLGEISPSSEFSLNIFQLSILELFTPAPLMLSDDSKRSSLKVYNVSYICYIFLYPKPSMCLLGTTPESTSVCLVCVGTHFRQLPVSSASMTTSPHTALGWLDKFAICVHTRGTWRSLCTHNVFHTVEDSTLLNTRGLTCPWSAILTRSVPTAGLAET